MRSSLCTGPLSEPASGFAAEFAGGTLVCSGAPAGCWDHTGIATSSAGANQNGLSLLGFTEQISENQTSQNEILRNENSVARLQLHVLLRILALHHVFVVEGQPDLASIRILP